MSKRGILAVVIIWIIVLGLTWINIVTPVMFLKLFVIWGCLAAAVSISVVIYEFWK